MRPGRSKLLKYCLLFLLTGCLVAGTLLLEPPGDGASPGRVGDFLKGSKPGGAGTGETSGLFVVRFQSEELRKEEETIRFMLNKLGAESGDLLGKDLLLVRLPASGVAQARAVLGAALEPYLPEARLAPELLKKIRAAETQTVEVNVTLFQETDKETVARAVQGLGGLVVRGRTEPGRVLRVRIPVPRLSDLAGLPDVIFIEPASSFRFLNDRARDITGVTPLSVSGFLPLTPASSSTAGRGLTGAKQIVALADSGLDKGSTEEVHPDLKSLPGQMPKVVMLKSWAGASLAADPDGHGTHMAATIAGSGAASQKKFQGIAPGASIYFQGLLNPQGKLDPPPDLTALFEPAYAAGARIHVNGWGGEGGGYLGAAAQTDQFVRRHPDFLVIYGAGNSGPGDGSLTPEAATKNGLVVGASQSPHPLFNPNQSDATEPAAFSSRGPTRDGRLKPEILAPGAVVSARTRLGTDESGPGSFYTYMEGTSMAAAVAGGSAALLREYFQKYEAVANPTAALLKAVLICGARSLPDGPSSAGFGILDLGGTILALREKTFRYHEAKEGVGEGKVISYTFQVRDGSAPLKATLAWTDPEVAPGSTRPLVNNLDLVVRDPEGKEFRGNAFLFPEKPDDVNNVEQVLIPRPVPGTYTIFVKGTEITRNTVSGATGKAQDFALVFGQPLARDVITAVGDRVSLASGREVALVPEKVRFVQNGRLLPWPSAFPVRRVLAPDGRNLLPDGDVPIGGDIYLPQENGTGPGFTYIAARTWLAEGVQVLETDRGFLVTEINPGARSGGFYLAPGAQNFLWANGVPVTDPASLPPGGEVRGWLNPATQALWGAAFSFSETDGFLSKVDLLRREIFLLGNPRPLSLASQAALAYLDELVEVDPADLPFGAGSCPDWEKLLPGLRVKLVCNPRSGDVMYVGARRQLAIGTLARVDADAGEVFLTNGSSFRLRPGISLQLDQKEITLEQLRPGQHVVAVLLPDTGEALALNAHSGVGYGRVVYISTKNQVLYLIDDQNRFRVFNFKPDTMFFRWGLPAEAVAVEPGNWARFYLGPEEGAIRRIDLAETTGERKEVLYGYDRESGALVTEKGTYYLSARTQVTKNGYPITPEDLVPGEEVTLTPFLAEGPRGPLLAAVAARMRPGVTAPRLEVAASWRNGDVVLSGVTSADRLYLYRPEGGREAIPPGRGGQFTCYFTPGEEGRDAVVLQVVAVDSRTGGVTGQFVTLPPAPAKSTLKDLAGHWATGEVEALLAQGLVTGYPDGTFRPGAPVTRAELTLLLCRALGWSGATGSLEFADAGVIPAWARPAVMQAVQRGLVSGYPDGYFRPNRALSRTEATVLLARVLDLFVPELNKRKEPQQSVPPWQDWAQVPGWAQEAVACAFQAGITRGRTPESFAPAAPFTRAEAAVAVSRLLEVLRTGD
ncbi:MAG: S-layer homology domain-containing protein [Bacillota bacterium]|nr:S-layer homology domain-containing protein [Bacillota bacterium]